MVVVCHLHCPLPNVVHVVQLKAAKHDDTTLPTSQGGGLHLYIFSLDDETFCILTHLDHSVIIALVSAGAVIEGDGGAEVS